MKYSLRSLMNFMRPKSEPQTVNIAGLGEASSDRYGYWHFSQPLVMSGQEISFSIKCGERSPSDSEIAICRQVVDGWSDAWASVMSKLRQSLEVDDNGEREQFLANVRPVHLDFTAGLDHWEIAVEPDIYDGHIVTM